ncbi:MAG: AAA family ATPase [Burkholderiaceae bacterium]|nr:AAA family ATPase [Burkholderiaceae bacterium]
MYQRHFGLSGEPFSIAPDPRMLYMSERHREALAHLLYGLRGGGGFVVLTGDVGTGKTTVCRCMLQQVPAGCNVAYVFNPALNVIELLRTICDEFHVPVTPAGPAPTRKDHVDALNAYLLRTHAQGQHNVLIVDEAQNLSVPVLEQLRLLTNLETDERKLLQIVLIGQPELRRLLARPELEQVAQRVIARYHLEPLGDAGTQQYVAHRLAAAGLQGPLPFDGAALRRIVHHSRGIPRRINLLADRALLGAFSLGRTQVDRGIVDRAAAEVFGDGTGSDGDAARRRRVAAGVAASVAAVVGLAGVALATWLAVAHDRQAPRAAAPPPEPVAVTASAPELAAAPAADDASAPAAEPAPFAAAALDDTIDALRRHLADAPAGDAGVWRHLAEAWGVALDGDDPCAAAERALLRCHRGEGGSVALLRRLDRPAVVTLRDEDGPLHVAALTALDARRATLQFADASFTVPIPVLAGLWRGEFATLWRPPPGYRGGALNPADAAQARWLGEQLDGLRADAGATAGGNVRERLRAFQAVQGLPADGLAGPLTLMQLNRAAGIDEPRLASD